MTTAREQRALLTGLGIAIVVILLVAGSVGAHRPGLVLLMIAGVAGTVLATARLLPQALALTTTLATCIAIYTVAFAGGAIAIFHHAHWSGLAAGFLLPLVGFVGGVAWRRQAIRQRLTIRRRVFRDRILVRGMGWLCLCFVLGILVVAFVPPGEDVVAATTSLIGAMALISATVVWLAPDIALLLDETGALFRLFLGRMKSRIVPIFSFLVVFLFIGVLFATLYALLDHHTPEPAFAMGGTGTRLDLPDAIYFSFVTLSTIGYGDVTPLDPVARVLVIAEIIFGVVLLLFAFAEIAAYNPEAELDEAVEQRGGGPEPR
jgi:hypothetical protein